MKHNKYKKVASILVILNFVLYQILFLMVPSANFLLAEDFSNLNTTSDYTRDAGLTTDSTSSSDYNKDSTATIDGYENTYETGTEAAVIETNDSIGEKTEDYYNIPDSHEETTSNTTAVEEETGSAEYIEVTRDDVLFTGEESVIEVDEAGPLEITFVERMESPFSGEKRITVFPNQIVEKIDFEISGPKNKWISGQSEPSGDFYIKWNTVDFPDGHYTVKATAYKNGKPVAISFSVDVKNEAPLVETQKYDIYNQGDNYESVENYIKEEWTVEGIKTDTILGETREYYYPEDNIYKPDNFIKEEPYYEVVKESVYEKVIYPECEANNIYYTPDCKEFMAMSPECRGKGFKSMAECEGYMFTPPECREKNMSQAECDKFMMIPPECRYNNILDPQKCKEFMYTDSMPLECQQAGVTSQEECNKIVMLGKITYECQRAGINDREKCGEFMRNQFLLTPECRDNRIHDPVSCKIFMADKFMPVECQQAGVTTKDECDYLLRNKYQPREVRNIIETSRGEVEFFKEDIYYDMDRGMPRECQAAGIVTPEECEKIMFNKDMPQECEKAGASTKEECDKIMFTAHMPRECQEAGISDAEKCKQHMELIYMPSECQEAGASNMEECEQILFKKYAPKECVAAGILEPKACDKHMFELHVPGDCLENGIKTAEACKKFMFEKYSGGEEIPVDKFPLECQKAGANTPSKCDKVMKELYMPGECKDKGITDEGACEYYMKQKYMPVECREAGAETRADCDKIMFKKYSPRECQDAGIENDRDCEDFMFNKYFPKVDCRGLDEWQCKNSIKDRHIGNIVAKQIKFREIKEKVLGLAGESVKLEKLKERLEVAQGVIPIAGEKVGLKVLAARAVLSLDEDDNLIQTAPVALMIDSDEDGLPDDLEKRLGSDPYNSDSDGDGYLDGVEYKNKFNPAGEGRLAKAMAPIDQAIMENRTLGQPKTEGEESAKLVIKNIKNLTDEAGKSINGYELSGEAEPNTVITLYIYSELPVVVTVDVDEYGNWQYNFNQSLVDGEHEIYVAVNDNTGRVITKSTPLGFFVKEAKAISITDFVAPAVSSASPLSSITKDFILYYIIGGLVIFIGLAAFIIFYFQKSKKIIK